MYIRFAALLLTVGALLFLTSCTTDPTVTPNPASTAPSQSTYPSTYTPPSKSYGGGRY